MIIIYNPIKEDAMNARKKLENLMVKVTFAEANYSDYYLNRCEKPNTVIKKGR